MVVGCLKGRATRPIRYQRLTSSVVCMCARALPVRVPFRHVSSRQTWIEACEEKDGDAKASMTKDLAALLALIDQM